MARVALLAVLAFTVLGCVGRPAPEATGEEIYLQLCSRCHGVDLQGRIGPSLGPGSNAASRPDTFLETTILRGRGSMPSFQGTLSGEQVRRLIEFLREEEQG